MDTQDPDDILQQWLSGHISDEELQKHLSKEEVLKYKQIIQEVDDWTTGNDPMAIPDLPHSAHEVKVIRMDRRIWMSIAASVLLLITIGIWFVSGGDEVYYSAKIGETLDVTLPDGISHVILASGSSVRWDKNDWKKGKRYSSIEGTVFYEVEKGSPFKVSIGESAVEVLGTSFEIRERAGRLAVSCFTGRVRVTGNSTATKEIVGGQSVRWDSKDFEPIDTVIVGGSPSWLDGKTTFKDAPLMEVVAQMELQFGIDIETSQIETDRRYTGSFEHASIDQALTNVFAPLAIEYSRNGAQVTLSE
jgi:transmembrane sensor